MDEITRIDLSTWEGWLAILPAGLEPPSAAAISARLAETIESGDVEVVVAELDRTIAGRASFGSSRDPRCRRVVAWSLRT